MTSIILTGAVFSDDAKLISAEVDPLDGNTAGDIKIYTRTDAAGRAAMQGGNTNYGFSGNIATSVYTGESWKRFSIRGVILHEIVHYSKQSDISEAAVRAAIALHQLKGRSGTVVVPEGKKQEAFVLD